MSSGHLGVTLAAAGSSPVVGDRKPESPRSGLRATNRWFCREMTGTRRRTLGKRNPSAHFRIANLDFDDLFLRGEESVQNARVEVRAAAFF